VEFESRYDWNAEHSRQEPCIPSTECRSLCLYASGTPPRRFGRMTLPREASMVTTGAKFLASGLPGPTPRKGNRISQHWNCLPATAQDTDFFPSRLYDTRYSRSLRLGLYPLRLFTSKQRFVLIGEVNTAQPCQTGTDLNGSKRRLAWSHVGRKNQMSKL
jgi:hypothetical protein